MEIWVYIKEWSVQEMTNRWVNIELLFEKSFSNSGSQWGQFYPQDTFLIVTVARDGAIDM